jgi:hypothetical protein
VLSEINNGIGALEMPTPKKKSVAVPAPTIPAKQKPVPVPADAVWISAKQLLARYGNRSAMWLVRKLKMDADFPRQVYFGRLMFFEIAKLEKYEREAVTRGSAAHAKAEEAEA